MSRTNDVNIAMQYAKSGVDGVHLMDSHKATIGWVVNTLAAEVERLEAGLVKANEAARAAMYAIDERAFLAECAEKSEKRAEAAEARAKELERIAELRELEQQTAKIAEDRIGQLEAQNARLRAALEDVSLLAHCISKAGPLNTPDLETAWRKFDLISVKAAEALVDRKAALNGEEASK